MDGMIGGAGGVGMIGGVGSPGTMGGVSSSLTGGNATISSLLPDATVNISAASRAALAADIQQSMLNSAQQPPGNDINGALPAPNTPSSISSAAWQNVQSQNQNLLLTELMLLMLMQQLQNK